MSRAVDGSDNGQTTAWPQIGSDIVAIGGTSETKPLLVVLCDSEQDSDLWGANFNLVSEELDMNIMTLNDTWDEDILSSLKQHGGRWASNHVCVLEITKGKQMGCRAVGVGSNVKKRKKAARLAMAATLAILKDGEVISEFQHFVAQARLALSVGNDIPSAPPLVAKDPYPARLPAKFETAANDSVEDKKGGEADGVPDPTAPTECLEDPFTELRVWTEAENGQPAVMWPYCTKCRCWTDVNHHRSKHHQKALAKVHLGTAPPEDCKKVNAKPSHTIANTPPVNTEAQVNSKKSTNYAIAAQQAHWLQQQNPEAQVNSKQSTNDALAAQQAHWIQQQQYRIWLHQQQALRLAQQHMSPLIVSPSSQFGTHCLPHALPRSFEQPLQSLGHWQAYAPTASVPGPQRPWSHAIDSMPWSLPNGSSDSAPGPLKDSAITAESCPAAPVAKHASPSSYLSDPSSTHTSEFTEANMSKMIPSLDVPVALPTCRWEVCSTAATSTT